MDAVDLFYQNVVSSACKGLEGRKMKEVRARRPSSPPELTTSFILQGPRGA